MPPSTLRQSIEQAARQDALALHFEIRQYQQTNGTLVLADRQGNESDEDEDEDEDEER